ncbi:MAG: CocE/NonD family hydrolase [Candidatus Lokiarchaeota archaeon]|nr:CocE/NonD family hydrolase [Candidatus Lokiarchaeota archaeon]
MDIFRKHQKIPKTPFSRRDLGYGVFENVIVGVRAEPFLKLLEKISSPIMKSLHLIVYGEWLKGGSHKLKEVLIPTHDGAKLATSIFLPNEIFENHGKAPTILIRTPYWKDSLALVGYYLALKGYVALTQDIRGCGHSSPYGNNAYFFSERNDGIETARWIQKQFWYNGRIGMWGASYPALCEWMVSYDNGDLFQCLTPGLATPHMIWSAHNGLDILGIGVDIARIFHETTKFYDPISKYNKEWTHQATENQLLNPKYALYNDPLDLSNFDLDLDKDLRGLSFDEKAKKIGNILDIEFNKRDFGKFQRLLYKLVIQRRTNLLSKYMAGMLDYDPAKLSCPVLILSGWYDMFSRPAMEAFTELQEKGPKDIVEKSKIVVGPWAHGDVQLARGTIWEALFSPGGWMDFVRTFVPWKWYDYWLKDEKNDLYETGPVKIFVMNRNKWRYEQEWPLKRAAEEVLYLHSDGKRVYDPTGGGFLSKHFPKESEAVDEFIFDPMNPVITRGGNNLMLPQGSLDQEKPEERKDTLVYTSPPLNRGMEVTGNVEFILFAASDAEDTDFMIKLCEVTQKGKSFNVLDRGIRARFRDFNYHKPKLIEPGKIYEYRIPLGPTSNYFRSGNRIRIDITSSDWPKYNINANLGGKGEKYDYKVANQKIYHTAEYPSRLLLPVIFDYF